MVDDILCENCAYEIIEAHPKTGFCQNCQKAYELGKECGAQWVTG